MGTVYLLHFSTNYHHARHYVGYVNGKNVNSRIARHKAGTGARLIEVITQAGIDFELARTWEGDRNFERKLKKRKNAPKLCPICCGAEVSLKLAA